MACVQPALWDKYSSGGTEGTYMVKTCDVTDPVQGGSLFNCSLIAVLASLAWKQKIGDQPTPPYKFKFYRYDQNNNVVGDAISTDKRLPLDSKGMLMHAKSATQTEIWPALWEKAYYKWLEKLAGIDTDTPDYCNYNQWQSPVTLLFQLTAKSPYTIKSDGTSSMNADAVFSDIDGVCDGCRSTTNRIIRYPAVAWTFDSAAANPANAANPSDPPYPYSDSTIKEQHCYSLLGVAGKKDSSGKWTDKYIVLRNPFGPIKGDPNLPGFLYNAAIVWCFTNNLADTTDGIFALRADQFVMYFAGYSRVV